jgi:hypothetical protein
MTTDAMIDSMKDLALDAETYDIVSEAWVDDWGRFGNFTVIVRPKCHDPQTTNRLKKIVRELAMKHGVIFRDYFAPERMSDGSYNCSYWKFDLDCIPYNQATNSFSSTASGLAF